MARAASRSASPVRHQQGRPVIAVLGPGGSIGGAVLHASLTAGASDVYAVVRPSKVQHFQETGLCVNVDGQENVILPKEHPSLHVVGGLDALPQEAVVAACVKNDHLVSGLAGAGTRRILLFQNGLGQKETVKSRLPGAELHSANVYISASKLPDDAGRPAVKVGAGGHIEIGKSAMADTVRTAFANQGVFQVRVIDDIATSKWTKAAMNCAMNPLATLFRSSKGGLRRDPGSLEVVRRVIAEVCQVAKASGAFPNLSAEQAGEKVFGEWRDVVSQRNPEHGTSMQEDFRSGAATEIPVLNGYVVREAARHGIPVPFNAHIVSTMEAFEARRAQCETVDEFYARHGNEMTLAKEGLVTMAMSAWVDDVAAGAPAGRA